jgi:hypothetical protein
VSYTARIDASSSYVQRFGVNFQAPLITGAGWLPPASASDYPVPSGVARVRLIVENVCRNNLVVVDGAPAAYDNQAVGNAGIVVDHAPGSIGVEVKSPDGTQSEGILSPLTLVAGHYYVVRVYGNLHPQEGCHPDGQRFFEVSAD